MSKRNTAGSETVEKQKRAPLFRLAAKHFSSYKWINLKMAFVFACLAFLFCLFTGYNRAIVDERERLVGGAVSQNYILYSVSNSRGIPQNYKALEEKYCSPEAIASRISYQYAGFSTRMSATLGHMISTGIARYLAVTVDGKGVSPKDDTFRLYAADTNFPFSENDYKELEYRFGTREVLYGEFPEKEGEVALSEPFLLNYGLGKEAIGKHIALQIAGEDEPFFEGTLKGVIAKEFYELTGHAAAYSGLHSPAIILPSDDPIFKGKSGGISYYYPCEPIENEDLIDEMYTLGFNFAGKFFVSTVHNIDNIQVLANTLYVIIGSSLGVGLVLTVFLMMEKYMKVVARSSGIFMTFGMPRGSLNLLLLAQLLILASITVPLSAILTIAGYYVIGALMNVTTGINLKITAVKLAGMLALGIMIVAAISLLTFAYMAFRLRKKTVRELLVTEVN